MDNQAMETLVVHKSQLTGANMKQLYEAGYSIIEDSSLLIFARPIQQQSTLEEGETLVAPPPTPIHSGNSNKKPR